MSNEHAERVASAVRAELARRRIPQTLVAEKLGITQQAVSRRLTGVVPFDVAELHLVAELLGMNPGALLGDSPERASA